MATIDLFDLPPSGPLIGIDPGSKTLGIAACDAGRLIASPIETIKKGRKLGPSLDRLFEIIDQRKTVGLVMGLPLNMDGSEGPRAQSARALARNIIARRDIPIAFQDERLSSSEAERAMIAGDLSRARRAELIDASAAAIILQTAIDRLANAS
ncbi:Holliday junction resolvase RuvX [Henriciella algicola]|uniref:Putative pre-16S rRNA nuclease n=1 Tax=Henriciella algicola TaxID=1608422 RepID=A0A399RAZ3_9PROT|nr:Holliday junction resolvase RuvX [Henriciella algicola]RIJ28716.1 Holliday junction resolvase RuvX [Henriciella algicola]